MRNKIINENQRLYHLCFDCEIKLDPRIMKAVAIKINNCYKLFCLNCAVKYEEED